MSADAQAQLKSILTKRTRWVEANRENGFEEGILRLLSDLYPDQAHFVYELLQNAEDAGASEVSFTLSADALACQHNGRRLFTVEDVDSITSIGKSTKRDDINQIGKFGVGFKAVFSYTNTPVVFSGAYAFEIKDLVCPYPLDPPKDMGSFTQFQFPFNRSEKKRAACHEEIAATLSALSENTLMFLDNIRQIRWSIDGCGEGSVRAVDHGQGLLQIEHRATKKRPVSTYWLRFQEPYDEKRRLRVAATFALAFRVPEAKDYDPRMSIKEQFRIVPTDGRLCIFFPAERETTKLKFHIHGPYASTVDRASIPHSAQNKTLVQTTGTLVATSLLKIKAIGLLDRDFLGVLPTATDELDSFYEPIQNAVTGMMRTESLVPTDSGGHEKSTELIQSPRAIRALLGVEKLKFFLGDETTRWAIGCMQNSREDLFLKSLSIREWGWDEYVESLCARFENAEDDELVANLKWLAVQDDRWMASLYGMLCRAMDGDEVYAYQIQRCRIVRLEDGSHVVGSDAFFPDPAKREELSGLPTVRKTLLHKAKNKDAERTRRFLEQIDVKVIDEEQEIRLILAKWYAEGADDPPDDEHLKHMRRFIEYVQKQKPSQTARAAMLFRDYFIYQAAAKEFFRKPAQYLLDHPFAATGLAVLAEKEIPGFKDRSRLWQGYLPLVDRGFVAFAVATGVAGELPIEEISTWQNPNRKELHKDYTCSSRRSSYEIDQDYTIPDLDLLLKARDAKVSRIIWCAMCAAEKSVLTARYRPNSRCQVRSAQSLLLHELRTREWIPAKDGSFRRPCDIGQDDLVDGFHYNDTNGWLTAIQFGANILRQTEEFRRKREALESIGMPPQLLESWERLRSQLPQEAQTQIAANLTDMLEKQAAALIDANANGSLSADEYGKRLAAALSKGSVNHGSDGPAGNDTPVPDPERRRGREEARLDEDIADETKTGQRFQILPRKVWDLKRAEVRMFLEQQYGGNCQICDAGFKKRSGDPYFVALYLVPHTSAKWAERPGNVLCVCANCAAKLQHGAVEATGIEDQILAVRLTREGGKAPLRLSLQLCGEEQHITFTERHLLALQEIVKKSRESAASASGGGRTEMITATMPPQVPVLPMTTCTVCGCAVREDRLQRHLRKAHKRTMGS